MADAGRSRRASRGQPKSYRTADYYQGIIEDDSSSETDGVDRRAEKEDGGEFEPPANEEEEQDDDFAEAGEVEEDDENYEGAEGSDGDLPAGESVIDVLSDHEPGRTKKPSKSRGVDSEPMTTLVVSGHAIKIKPASAWHQGEDAKLLNRGVLEWGEGGQEARLKNFFGPSHENLIPVLKTRDHWSRMHTLPKRDDGHLHESYFPAEGALEKETRATRKWYADAGRELFAAGQKSRYLKEEEGKKYMVTEEEESLNVLLGDLKNPRVYEIPKGSYISTAEPFASKEGRKGWILNVGAKVREAQWVKNEQGSTQYLAIVAEQKEPSTAGRRPHKPLEHPQAPAYTPTSPFPASIQIWVFEANEKGEVDPNKEPRLELVICADWGFPKKIRWCPIGLKDNLQPSSDGDSIHLGFLAGIWSDGGVRVLDISYKRPEGESPTTQYQHYSHAAFESHFPNTISTTLHWLSGTSIAVANADGSLSIWTLTRPDAFPRPQTSVTERHNPQPWFHRQIADTYIIALVSGWPSRPNYVSITTVDGYSLLYDLRNHWNEVCTSPRGRMLLAAQAWHEHTQSFVMPDEYYFLRHNTIRRTYSNVYTMRMDSTIIAVATSAVHPSILVAGADGEILANNPTARMLNNKETPWKQTWFKHEWRPPIDRLAIKMPAPVDPAERPCTSIPLIGDNVPPVPSSPPPPSSQTNSQGQTAVDPALLARPMARLTEGYKAELMVLQHANMSKKFKDGHKLITVYEEKSAVSALAWNPNQRCGSWAVAGLGSGLVRVEDLGV